MTNFGKGPCTHSSLFILHRLQFIFKIDNTYELGATFKLISLHKFSLHKFHENVIIIVVLL